MRLLSLALSLLVILASLPARAAELGGYVVKADSGTVFLDLGEASGVRVGQNFVVYTEGEELKHPITGASLGRIESQLGKGYIQQIEEKYSVGAFEPKSADVKIQPGQKVKMLATFTASAVPQPQAAAPAAAVPTPVYAATAMAVPTVPPMQGMPGMAPVPVAASHAPIWKSPAMDFEAVGLAVGDVDGDGKNELILADLTHIAAYPQTGDWKPVCEYTFPETGAKILSIDAADLDKNGKAELFVTHYNGAFDRVETAVLACNGKEFERVATLPFMVRSYQDETGAVRLATQQLLDDATFPFGGLYALEYKDGKYQTGKAIKAPRLEWLYGFVLAKDSGGDAFPLFVASSGRLRAQFRKRAWISQDAYDQTGSRLRWKDRDQLLMFRPRLISAQAQGNLRGLYTLDQTAGLGTLGSAFGYFTDSKLSYLQWDGLSLQPAWSTPSLGGYAADLAMVPDASGQPAELWIAVVSAGGRVSVQKFLP